MSLILDALKKAKDLAGRKPAVTPPTALASFRFGRPSRSEKIKKIGLLAVLGLVCLGSLAYTVSFWVKRVNRQRAILIQAPRPLLPEPVAAVPETALPQGAAKAQNVPVPDQPKDNAAHSQLPAQSVAAVTPSAVKPPVQAAAPAATANPPAQIARRLDPPAQSAPTPAHRAQDRPAPARPAEAVQVPTIQTAAASLPPSPAATPNSPAAAAIPPSPPAPAAQPPVAAVARGGIVAPSRDPFELGVFYQKSGDYLKALEQYSKVLEKDPLNASVYNNLGLIHYTTGNSLEAIKAFRQATYIDPKYDKAHNNLGLALRQTGQDAEAQREFERALQLNPKNTEALTNLAALARKSGNIERAKVQYLQAIQANPDNAEAHYNLAMLYAEQGENGNAIDHFKKFLNLGSSAHPEVVSDVERKIEELSKKR